MVLVCDGFDTIADLYLNGTSLGHAENMFRRWEWDVKSLLKEGSNELLITFGSPVRFITARQAQLPLQGGGDIPGGPHLRKAPCHWGWDWGPKLPPIGVWKEIRLEGYSLRFENVRLRQSLDINGATITADIETGVFNSAEIKAFLKVTSPNGEQYKAKDTLLSLFKGDNGFANLSVEIPDPQLWWPNGYGSQPLYDVEVTLKQDKNVLDRRTYKLGLREIELCQEQDQWGKEFTFYVKGVRLFAKGADWIPADSFPTRLTVASLEGLLKRRCARSSPPACR